MMPSLIRNFDKKGFTLVEVIVTIVAAAILGAIFINFMGTAMTKSTRAVLNVEAEANAQALMEQIVSDYTVKINEGLPAADPPDALDYILRKNYGASVTKQYITFDSSGNQVGSGIPGTPTDTLKITVMWDSPDVTQAGGTAITTLLTKSRLSAADPAVAF
jgi:prepilin-type N-terminal cleavage/methylation domain-containing protein